MKHSPRFVRQIDVAREVGVSRALVACVFTQPENGPKKYAVNPDTERRIREMAAKMGYRPNMIGRSLRHRKSFLVGVLNSAVNYSVNAELCAGIQSVLMPARYAPIVYTNTSLADEEHALGACLDRQVEGLIVNTFMPADQPHGGARLAKIHRGGLPMIEIFGSYIPGVSSVVIDYERAGHLAAETLWERSHRRIALFIHDQYRKQGGDGRFVYWTAEAFWRGYESFVKERGEKPLVVTFPFATHLMDAKAYYQDLLAAAQSFLSQRRQPTAVIAQSQSDVEPLLDLLSRKSGTPPAGFLASALGMQPVPLRYAANLVVLDSPARRVGEAAAKELMKRIGGPSETRRRELRIAPTASA